MFNCELFANNIKNIREVHGLSMNDLASFKCILKVKAL